MVDKSTPRATGRDADRGSGSPCRSHNRRRRDAIATKPRKGLKLLFADDERSLQELMRIELSRMGHEATICPDGATAAAALARNTYDCLIVDLDMPGLNGIQVIERAKDLSPDTEAVVLTGKSSVETAIAALRQGAFDYLTKPCKLAELERCWPRGRKARTDKQISRRQAPFGTARRALAVGRPGALDGARAAIDRQGSAHDTRACWSWAKPARAKS